MSKIEELLKKFSYLFPEESFWKGLDTLKNKNNLTTNKKFYQKFYQHLNYYEENYYPLTFEKIYKAGNFLFYYLILNKKIKKKHFKIIKSYLNFEISNNLFNSLALKYFREVFTNYICLFPNFKKEFKISISVKSNKFSLPFKNFVEWMKGIYDLDLLSLKMLLKESFEIKEKLQKLNFTPTKFKQDPQTTIKKFLEYYSNYLSFDFTKVKVLPTPPYLYSINPTASAYTYNLLNRPDFFVFINYSKNKNPAKLFFILSHEILGHIYHFNLIHQLCQDQIKKLPYYSRFPLTEGFALLVEDFIFEKFSQKETLNYFNNLIIGDLDKELRFIYYKYRLLRYLRAIFEYQVYFDYKNPYSVIKDLSRKFSFEENFLKEDLLSFLITPGYASTYIGGYKILKKLGLFEEESFRKQIGKLGFEFISEI